MFALGLIFLGINSYRELPIQRLPEVTFPSLFYMAWIEDSELSPEEPPAPPPEEPPAPPPANG